MIKETANLDLKVKGHPIIQLFENGKVIKEVEGDNFFGKPSQKFITGILLQYLSHYLKNNSGDVSVLPVTNKFERIVLTDNTAAVDSTARKIPGNLIGYADYDEYIGTSTTRGTINVGESSVDLSNGEIQLVFDWPTNAANGTFQTVGFSASAPTEKVDKVWSNSITLLQNYSDLAVSDSHIFYTYSTNLCALNKSTGESEVLKTFSSSLKGICYHDGKVYVTYDTGTNDTLAVYDIALETVTTITSSFCSCDDNSWIGIYGGYIYAGRTTTYDRIYKCNLATGDVITYKTISSTNNKFCEGGCTVTPAGLVLSDDGDTLSLDDLFNSDTETTGTLQATADSTTSIFYDGTDLYFVGEYDCPNIEESSADNGLAEQEVTFIGTTEGVEDLGTCIVLDSPVTKLDTQTMKITYTFTITIP